MYRASALPSLELEDVTAERLRRFAARMRVVALVLFVGLGVGAGLFALDRLQEWAHVFVMAYATAGLLLGYFAYRAAGLPLLRLWVRRKARKLASSLAISSRRLEAVALMYLV